MNKLLTVMLLGAAFFSEASVFVDDQGIMRWSESKDEVCVFGINYAPPFAYWDARAPIGADQKKAIDEDVYHIARLGVDGYRIHVWPSVISDEDGNLIYNERFQLFDYLLFKLKERGIKLFITPMYLSGGDGSFVKKWGGKAGCLTNPDAFPAQANYLAQFVAHVNPYTGIAYMDDPDLLGFEIVNEPPHFKRPDLITGYINRMVQSIRAAGCTTPLFYNMTTSADHIDQILAADIDGGTFQWYPTGLTANHDQKGNLLPNVDRYVIPFADRLEGNMPKFVYEFSPSDVGASSHLYPAMARSFREAGFQFAAHFAYDPMHAAYCNIAYRTHFMNLAYTPKKAIGLLIASEAFHTVSRGQGTGRYPENRSFCDFTLSSENDLAERVSDQKFLYSGSTSTVPPKPERLEQIAGTGRSSIVSYSGTGAYFVDKLEPGVWRLEVMPDAVWVRDPFFVADVRRVTAVVQWNELEMTLNLPDLGRSFSIAGLNSGNTLRAQAADGRFLIRPGSYLLTREEIQADWNADSRWKNIRLGEFHAPDREADSDYLIHAPPPDHSVNEPLTLKAEVVTAEHPDRVELIVLGVGGGTTVPMKKAGPFAYEAELPLKLLQSPGILRYNISVSAGDQIHTWPSGTAGSHLLKRRVYGDDRLLDDGVPYAVRLVAAETPVCLFDADEDWHALTKAHRKDRIDLMPSAIPGKSLMHLIPTKRNEEESDYSVRSFCRERIKMRSGELDGRQVLNVYGRSLNDQPCRIQVALITKEGHAFGGQLMLRPEADLCSLPIAELKPVKSVLLPRPYPRFNPYWFEPSSRAELSLGLVESVQISIGPGLSAEEFKNSGGAAIGWITLE